MNKIKYKLIFAFFLGMYLTNAQTEKAADLKTLFNTISYDSIIKIAGLNKTAKPTYARLLIARLKSENLADSSVIKLLEIEASIYNFIGDYPKEMETLKQLISKYNTTEKLTYNKQIGVLISFSNVYYNLKEYPLLLKTYLDIITIAEKEKDTLRLIRSNNGAGFAHKLMKNYNKALFYYENGLQYVKDATLVKSDTYHATLLGNSGLIFTEFGDYDEAINRFRKSLEIRKKLKNIGYFAGSHLDIAEVYQQKKNLDSAIFYNKRAIDLVAKVNGREWMLRGYLNLSKIYAKQQDFKNAFFFKTKHDSINQLMFNEVSLKKQAYLKAELDLEKNITELEQQQIQLAETSKERLIFIIGLICVLGIVLTLVYTISKKNNIIKRSLLSLEKNNKEKEILLSEIHHRVKNNLQMVSSLLSLQSNVIKSPEVKAAFNQGKSRIKTMSLVHEQLYQKDSFSKISFKIYLEEIIKNTTASFKAGNNFSYKITSTLYLPIDFGMTLGLIINEMLTNTLKYNVEKDIAFEIAITENNQFYTLKVSDNGIGFDTSKINSKDNNLGFKLIEILCKQIEANLALTTSLNNGVKYIMTIPKISKK